MQDYLGSRPQLERGALGSSIVAECAKMKLLAIWFCGNRSMTKGASEDRLAHFVHLLEADTGDPRDYLPAAMDDRTGWRQRLMGEGGGGGGVRGGGVD